MKRSIASKFRCYWNGSKSGSISRTMMLFRLQTCSSCNATHGQRRYHSLVSAEGFKSALITITKKSKSGKFSRSFSTPTV